jgi:hypothetical protein
MAKTGSQALEEAKKKINDPNYNVFSGNVEKNKNKQTGENKRRIKTSDVINTGSMLVGGPALGLGAKAISKLAPKLKNLFRGTSKTKPKQIQKNKKVVKATKSNKPLSDKKNSKKISNPILKNQKTNKPLANKNKIRDNIVKGALVTGTGAAVSNLLPKGGSSNNVKNKKVELPKSRPKDIKPNIIKSKPIKKTNITSGGNTGFGAKGNVFVSSEKRRKELMDKFGGTGSAAAKAAMRGTQGNMVTRAAGGLKPLPEGNKGLGKLPSPVRNKMGYMKKGGIVKMRGGGAATRGMNFNRGR